MSFQGATGNKLKRINSILAVIAGVFIVAFVTYCSIVWGRLNSMKIEDPFGEYDGVWTLTTEEGTSIVVLPCEVVTDGDHFTLSTTLRREQIEKMGNTAMILNNRAGLVASIGDELLYQINISSLYKITDSNGYCVFTLPTDREEYVLSLDFYHIKGSYQINKFQVGSLYRVYVCLLEKSMLPLIMIVVLVVIAIAMTITVVYFAIHHLTDRRLVAMPILLATLSTWAFADSSLPQFWGISLEISSVLSNVALSIIPIAIIFFMWDTTGKQHRIYNWLILLALINIIGQIFISMAGILTLHKMLYLTYGVLAISVIVSLALSVRELHKGESGVILRHSILAMIILALTFVVSGLMYVNNLEQYSMVFLGGFCVVLLMFFAMVMISYMMRLQDHRKEMAAMSLYEELALKDSMTDLGNRRGFELRMKEFDTLPKSNPDAVLIILDLNGLKRINDDYGHAAGDEAIVAVAHGIRQTYGLRSECFRIGGDEFAVIMTDLSMDVRMLNREFEAFINHYNETAAVRISVAKGSADLYDRSGRRCDTTEWKQAADLSMYADKQLYSSGRTISRAEDLQAILDCIIGLVEAKDRYTAKHSERVRAMSVRIASWMNLSPDTIEQVDMAAHLHDIGKIAIPESILTKPGKLTQEEFGIMKEHPVAGALVIEKAKNMSEVAEIVKHHHERFDGKGYPLGLSGNDIPLGARIVAVADSIDAMTSKRCYRDSLGLDVCRDEITRNLGIMYDPAIGSIALDHWLDIVEIIQRG